MAAIDNEMRLTEAEKIFKVSRSAIYDWFILRAETNSLEPKKSVYATHIEYRWAHVKNAIRRAAEVSSDFYEVAFKVLGDLFLA